MGLIRYKTLKEARRENMKCLIEESIKSPSYKELGKRTFENVSLYHHPYRSGLYRFKSWEDARKFDMAFMIRNFCRRNAHDQP